MQTNRPQTLRVETANSPAPLLVRSFSSYYLWLLCTCIGAYNWPLHWSTKVAGKWIKPCKLNLFKLYTNKWPNYLLLLLLFCTHSIHSAVCTMWMSVFFPIIPAILKILTIAFTLSLIENVSIKKQEVPHTSAQDSLGLIHVYNIVAFFWSLHFISGLSEMTLAGTFGAWYWTSNKKQVPANALGTALFTTLKYHMGTLALGSVMLTICRMLCMIFGVGGKKNACGPLMCFRCCLTFMDKFLRRFNRNAYIMCAIHGESLCPSALAAYQLILRNVLRYVALDWVTGIVFGLSKLLLAIGAATIGYAVYVTDTMNEKEKAMMFVPIGILAIGAYLIAGAFLSVYAMAVDTLVLCFRKCFFSLIFRGRFSVFRQLNCSNCMWFFSNIFFLSHFSYQIK